VLALVFVLRSRRTGAWLYQHSETFVRRFEIAVYCGMALGIALVFVGIVVVAA
jgi:hypothetical protein